MKKAVLYARVSSKDQEREGYSIPAQLDLLRSAAKKEGFQVVGEYIDVESASQPGRTKFSEMVKFLKKNPCTIFVEKTDRLYRNFRDALTLDDLGVTIRFFKQGLSLGPDSKSSDRLIHNINVAIAKNYSDNLSEEVKKGLDQKAKQGIYPAGVFPIGYRRVSGEIQVDYEVAAKIRHLFEYYATGNYSITEAHQEAKRVGLKYPKSGRYITRSEVERLLKKPFYCGKFTWRGDVYQGNHPSVVSTDLFNRVQEVFKSRNRPVYSKQNFPFIGLIKCGNCGLSITAGMEKKRYVYYHCTGYGKRCKPEYYRQEILEGMFGDVIKSITIPQELHDWLLECLELEFKTRKIDITRQKEALVLQKDKIETRMKKAYQDKLEGKVSDDFWKSVYNDWERELEGIKYQLQNLDSLIDLNFDWAKEAIELSQAAYSLYVNADPVDKRKLLKSVLLNCELKGGSLYPLYRKPFSDFANGHEPAKWRRGRDSNPGWSFPHNCLAGSCLQPLGHLSR